MFFNKSKYTFIIAGLGNPGSKYDGTRHNAGFAAVDFIAEQAGFQIEKKQFEALTGEWNVSGKRVLVLKPLTFMNLSGRSVAAAMNYFKMSPEQLLIVFDDINFEPGQIRIKKDGSSGGHNGLKSIETSVGTQNYKRIKIGVGKKPPEYDLADWVLGKLQKEGSELIAGRFGDIKSAAELIIGGEIERAMNLYNRD